MQISRYTAQRLPQQARSGPGPSPGDVAPLVEAQERLISTGAAIATHFSDKIQEADDTAWVTETTGRAQREMLESFNAARQGAGEGASGFAANFMADFDKYAAQAVQTAPSGRARQDANARFSAMRTAFHADATGVELVAGQAKRTKDFNAGLDALATAAYQSPGKLEVLLKQHQGDLAAAAATWMTSEQATRYRGAGQQVLVESALRGMIAHNPNQALKALDQGEVSPVQVLTVSQRQSLQGAARAELSRRQTAWNAQRREYREELRDVVDIMEAGFNPGIDRLKGLSAGITRLGDPELTADLRGALEIHAFQQEARGWTPADLQNWITEENGRLAKSGEVSALETKRIELAGRLLNTMNTEIRRDPLSWAGRAGVREIRPVNLTGDDAVDSMKRRTGDALTVAAYYGAKPKFLTDEESHQLRGVMESGNPDTVLGVIASIRSGFGAHTPDVLGEISKDAPVGAHIAGLSILSQNHARTARDAVVGQQILKTTKDILPPAVDRKAMAAETYGAAFGGSPTTGAIAVEVANAIFAARAHARGLSPESDSDTVTQLYEASLQEAAGASYGPDGTQFGGIVNINGVAVIAPSNVSATKFRAAMSAMQDDDLIRAGGGDLPKYTNGKAFTAKDLRQKKAWLVSIGEGEYLLSATDPAEGPAEFLQGSGPGGYFVLSVGEVMPDIQNRLLEGAVASDQIRLMDGGRR